LWSPGTVLVRSQTNTSPNRRGRLIPRALTLATREAPGTDAWPSATQASEGPRHASRVECVCSYRCAVGECLADIVGRLGKIPPREVLHAWPRPEVAREAPQGGNAAYRAQPRRYPVPDARRLSSLTHLVRPEPRGYGERIHAAAAATWIEALCCRGLPSPTTTEVEGEVVKLEREEIGPVA